METTSGRYNFESQATTDLIMDVTHREDMDPTDLTEAVTNTLRIVGVEIYIDAPNDDGVCEVQAPRSMSPEEAERYIRGAVAVNL